MSAAPRILFWVQHLLGMGHLHRAARLARALAEAGLEVTLASGGPEVPGLRLGRARLVQLPPLRASDRSFRELLHPGDIPSTKLTRPTGATGCSRFTARSDRMR